MPVVYAGMATHARENRAEQLLGAPGLLTKTANRPSQLSGGQQQQSYRAVPLMNGGDVILADEPTGALDSKSGADVMAILQDLNRQGHTIIMVTHDPSIAAQAQRVIEIKDGRILKDYYTEQPRDKPSVNTNLAFEQKICKPIQLLDRLTEAFKMSVLAMKAHKMRTLLTMLGIIIGIALSGICSWARTRLTAKKFVRISALWVPIP